MFQLNEEEYEILKSQFATSKSLTIGSYVIEFSRIAQENVKIKRREGMAENENEVKNAAGESKSDKFKRLASKRVVNAIQKIELITNLAASSYESTPEEVAKILTALQGSVDKVKAAFSKQKIDKTTFKL